MKRRFLFILVTWVIYLFLIFVIKESKAETYCCCAYIPGDDCPQGSFGNECKTEEWCEGVGNICCPGTTDCAACGGLPPTTTTSSSTTTTTTTTSTTTTLPIHAKGIALYYYTGERINGNITFIPVETPEDKTSTDVTNGEWSLDSDFTAADVLHLTFIVDDDEKIGYNELKLDNDNPSTARLNCSTQNISVSGYSVDVGSGNPITSGNVKISALDTDYTNTTSFSGTWSIDFHPCLVSGRIYTIQILVSDNTGERGVLLQKYPAR